MNLQSFNIKRLDPRQQRMVREFLAERFQINPWAIADDEFVAFLKHIRVIELSFELIEILKHATAGRG